MTHQVTEESRKTVENASGIGMPHEMIAILIGVKSVKTLRKRYRVQLDMGKAKACFTVAGVAFAEARKGVPSMVKWWTATQMGWRETTALEVANKPGEAFETKQTYVPGAPQLLQDYYAKIAQSAAAADPDPRAAPNMGQHRSEGDESGEDPDAGPR